MELSQASNLSPATLLANHALRHGVPLMLWKRVPRHELVNSSPLPIRCRASLCRHSSIWTSARTPCSIPSRSLTRSLSLFLKLDSLHFVASCPLLVDESGSKAARLMLVRQWIDTR